MGSVVVDQIRSDGTVLRKADERMSEHTKAQLLLRALPGAWSDVYAGVRVVRVRDQVLFKKQVTHLGTPWPVFKKRIQIPSAWVDAARRARLDGLVPRFIGIYSHDDVTIFVDFDRAGYLRRKANNSAAHVATLDLHRAQVDGVFTKTDRNNNRLTSVRADRFDDYLREGIAERQPALDIFKRFNRELFASGRIAAMDAVREMHAAVWPDRFQGEWAGFYLEFRVDRFLREEQVEDAMKFQKMKRAGEFDYDLVFSSSGQVDYYGDLKASDLRRHESPGNDAESLRRCIEEYGKFWYVIFEHQTWMARDRGDQATIEWNEWKRTMGHQGRKAFNPMSYAKRFKEAVQFEKMVILEVNAANLPIVLSDFRQGQQQGGAPRALKFMINKRNIDNYLVFSDGAGNFHSP